MNSELFSQELAQKAENLGKLPDEWLQVIYDERWFKLFVPKELGGLGCNLTEALQIEEGLAKLDGSLGWTVTLCAGAAWFVGFMEKSTRDEVFPDSVLCLAGSGFVGGKANKVNNQYIIDGSWTYASGALHATNLTANCEILENGKAVLDTDGKPVVKAFLLKKDEVKILDGWNYMGMIATGSHAFEAENQEVPLNRCFEIEPSKTQLPDPIYKFPFLQFAEATLAVNIVGITEHMIDLIAASFWKRNEYRAYDVKHIEYFERLLKKRKSQLKKEKAKFYKSVENAWLQLGQEGDISKKKLKKVSKVSRKLTQKCREVNAKLYPFAGLEAAKTHTELNRVWRDFNTVGQHALLIFPF